MGNFWSCSACGRNPKPEPDTRDTVAEPDPVLNLNSDDEAAISLRRYLIDGDSSFLDSKNFSGNSWFSMVTTNFTSWISQASGALAAIWDDNAGEGNGFLAEMPDDALPEVGTGTIDSKLRPFTLEEMKAATFNFRPNMVVGMGGFGSVYKGWLKEKGPSQVIRKRAIAIKKLDKNSKQGFRQWQTEVGFLGKVSHPNIIKLLGYCRENDELMIVYEFMSKASLNYHLFGKRSKSSPLPWDIRVKVVIGMARGLCHIHTMEKPIIYRDFKPSNILLDESYTPKLSDFGLAKWGPTDSSFIRGHIMGTAGYADPEYVASGNLYVKTDVYSFGVVLIEILTGLPAIDKKRPPMQRNLANFFNTNLNFLMNKSMLKGMMDAKLEGKYSVKEASEIAAFAARCLNQITEHRPSMKEIVETLGKLEARYLRSVN